ncbi:hypothetical protein M3Y99_00820200 [Aphelenchoides fujianensis]|nr:hypothetical protein M3Y99_00820200 [Aphelenchoides fujianensis]
MPAFLRLSTAIRTLFHGAPDGAGSFLTRLFAFVFRPKPLAVASNPAVKPKEAVKKDGEMRLSTGLQAFRQLSSQPRKPMIKFVGHHGDVPRFDPAKAPAAQSSSGNQSATKSKAGGGAIRIDELDLPFHLRRRLPDAEECAVINSGGLRER